MRLAENLNGSGAILTGSRVTEELYLPHASSAVKKSVLGQPDFMVIYKTVDHRSVPLLKLKVCSCFMFRLKADVYYAFMHFKTENMLI